MSSNALRKHHSLQSSKNKFIFYGCGPDIPGLPMMNFEEKTKGWDVIFKGLISPFANRFKKYIQMEMNSHLRENDSNVSSDEDLIEMKKFKLKSKPNKSGKVSKGVFCALKRGITLSKLSRIASSPENGLCDRVLQYILSKPKLFKGDNPVCK